MPGKSGLGEEAEAEMSIVVSVVRSPLGVSVGESLEEGTSEDREEQYSVPVKKAVLCPR